MSNEISKQEYLKRYLESEKDLNRKRKKKQKRKIQVPSLKIVDKDIDLKSINFGAKAEEDEDDEAPVIAEIIDDRPMEEKIKELYQSSRWKKIADDDETSRSDSVATHRENRNKSPEKNNSSLSVHLYNRKTRHDSDSDISPPRIQERINRNVSSNLSPKRDQKRNHSDSDLSPPRSLKQRKRESRHDSDSDISLPRRTSSQSHSHLRQKKPKRHDSDSDISPPRHPNFSSLKKQKSKRNDSDSDISPPRHQTPNISSLKKQQSKRNNSDSDFSPPRQGNSHKPSNEIKSSSKRHDSDSDEMLSNNETRSSIKQKSNLNDYKQKNKRNYSISPPSSSSKSISKDKSRKLDKTLSGLKAGLQNSKTLQKEIQELREREKNQLNTLEDEISGRNADTVIRDRKTGLRRDLNEEQQKKNNDDKKAKEYEKKYKEWGKGVEQTMDKVEKLKDDLYEMSKPLARYQDDEDLDERLKSIIHDDDPMADYIKKKKQKDVPSFPVYSGPPAPPNRFGILPGYRWDGVDRSNGFEKKYFEKINKTKAVESEAYLWSVQDM